MRSETGKADQTTNLVIEMLKTRVRSENRNKGYLSEDISEYTNHLELAKYHIGLFNNKLGDMMQFWLAEEQMAETKEQDKLEDFIKICQDKI